MEENEADFVISLREGDEIQISRSSVGAGKTYEVCRSKSGQLFLFLKTAYHAPYVPDVDLPVAPTATEGLGDVWMSIDRMSQEDMEAGTPFLLWSPTTHTYPFVGRYWTQDVCWNEDGFYDTTVFPTHFKRLVGPDAEE